jgi:hypothetical protein
MMKFIFVACFFFLLIPFSLALAQFSQSDDFNIHLSIVTPDTVPPSAPSGLEATPVAFSQIDLSWIAAVDDVAIGGYQVFRDTVQIATTTLTTYSDTGLTASTTYTYEVVAFDTSFNYSSSSNSVATTTLEQPATTTPPENEGDGNGSIIKLISLDIEPGIHSADLSWETNRYAQFVLSWGRTTSYELGFVSNEIYRREHTTRIGDLESGTTYEYELLAYDREGKKTVLSRGQFKTLDVPDSTAPSNVTDLRAEVKGKDVTLTWVNPTDSDFDQVRIVRSYLFYSLDPYDGFIAYQGNEEKFLDRNALASRKVQYYTVFSYDKEGNISSGATVAVFMEGSAPSYETATSSDVFVLHFDDIEVYQDSIRVRDGKLEGDESTTLRIPYEKLPEHLKSIIVSFTHPRDPESSFSFLLRINKDKSYYEATIGPLEEVGVYPVTATIFDYETKLIKKVSGSYEVIAGESVDLPLPVLFVQDGGVSLLFILWLLLLLILLLLLMRLLYIAMTTNKGLVTTASLGGTFVVLLLLSASVIAYFEAIEDQAQVSLLPMAEADLPILILVGFAVLIAALSLVFYFFRNKSSK